MEPVRQGDVSLLQHPASQELLRSKIPARLAYVWTDGSPRVVPIWFHWNGRELVMASPPKAPKLKALANNPKVAITIDDNTFPAQSPADPGNGEIGKCARDCSRVRGRGRALFRCRTGQGLADSTAWKSDRHGAYHDHAAVGRTARFRDPLPQRAVRLTTDQAVRLERAFPCITQSDSTRASSPPRLRFSRHGDDTEKDHLNF